MIRIPHPVYAPDGDGNAVAPTGDAAAAAAAAKVTADAAAAAGDKSLLNNGGKADEVIADVTALPANWRNLMGGASNADVLKELERFSEPAKVGEALLNYKKQMRNGSLTNEAPPDGEKQPDQLKAWREARGIPLTTEGYKLDEALTKKLADNDKPLVDDFIGYAHKNNMPPAVVNFGIGWYTQMMENVAAEEAKVDKQTNSDAEEALRGDWGPAYKTNMAVAKRALAELIPGVNLSEARLPDGRLVGAVPEFIKGMVEYGITKYGDGSLIGEENVKRAEGRLKEIEAIIQNEPDKYTEAVRKEYFDLLNAQEKAKPAK